ncbi:MAG TPA: hypothetical protein DD723_01895 [Candidatus Omnitrophica bacterium]|nr:MAG: hypothetical protein A2Z81_08930 [Omnitrophica WOR_2 bacterium GWA2_45_18]OGX19784.1 MAG: hypothetical protein A2Y04_06050 [Omnitrophica WOR_2 bacterium GWC2_45_7]HBR14279.1 hypothetical protein [Candidatus Omnitrophota bacterium]
MSVTFRENNNIGTIEFDQEGSKVNLLTSDVIKRLDTVLDGIKTKQNLEVIVLWSKKKDVFFAGADIKEIEQITESQDGMEKARAGQKVLNKLEDLTIPTIAVIDGVALGGGCELSLACQYRLATFNDKVRIGLPEVNLGFVPGFGGTYRLPRIVGLAEGLKMILAGKPVDGSKALKIGLFDRLCPQTGLEDHLKKFISDIKSGKDKRLGKTKYARNKKKGWAGLLEGSLTGQSFIFYQTKKNVLKATKGFYPAPVKAVEVIEKNFFLNRVKGLEVEARTFGELAVTGISKNLVAVFYLSEKYKKLKLEGADGIESQPVRKCAVLGAGVMGGGIAQLLASRDIWVRLKDINYDAVAKGFQAANKIFKDGVKKRKLTKAQAMTQMAHITGTLDYSGFKTADYVIEAVVENMDIKKKVFKDLSGAASEHAILATNTSALSVTEMAKETSRPEKVIGFHFFNPVHRMPLVEVITTPMTSKETIVTTLALVKQLGKIPILVKDSCGFLVNRVLLGYVNEAGRILEECGEMEKVDRLMTDFGMPMGPFALSDEVGLDVGIKVLHILEKGINERYKPVEIFETIFKAGYLGKKSGQGFYSHGKERTPNPEINRLITGSSRRRFDPEVCRERLLYIMINEAARCLEEGVIDGADTVDTGMIFGTGFPPFRGGLLRYADTLGIDHLVSRLEKLGVELNAPRFQPAKYILDLREKRKGFFKG